MQISSPSQGIVLLKIFSISDESSSAMALKKVGKLSPIEAVENRSVSWAQAANCSFSANILRVTI